MAERAGGASVRSVRIEGLKELQAALRDADKDFPSRLRVANLKAAQVTAETARFLALGTSRMAAKASDSIRASAEQRAAKITFGGAKAPFAFGANWGAHHDAQRTTSTGRTMVGWNQFAPFHNKPDSFFYRAIDESTPEPFMSSYEKAIDEMIQQIVTSHPWKGRGLTGTKIGH